VISVSLIIALQAPSAYIERNPPAERTLVISRWVFLLLICSAAWLVAEYSRVLLKNKKYLLVMVLFLILATFYISRAIFQTIDYYQPRFERIASAWDERDDLIRSQKARGVEIIYVRAIDSQYLGGGILEWYPQPNWVNMCAAEYYQVKEIRATLDW
jgi:hypothetical protein